MLTKLQKLIIDKWTVNDPLPNENVWACVMISHGATDTHLTKASKTVLEFTDIMTALERLKKATVLFCTFAGSSKKGQVLELGIKRDFLQIAIHCGVVWSTIEECLAIIPQIPKYLSPIVIFTDAAHSRRCKLVWETLLPDTEIYVLSIPISGAVDPESPMVVYRSVWKLLFFHIAPMIIFWPVAKIFGKKGLIWISKFHQPTTKKPARHL